MTPSMNGRPGDPRQPPDHCEPEAALRESRHRLSLALEAGQLGLALWNLRTGDLWWSPRTYQIMGHAAPRANEFTPTYERWLSQVHPDDRTEVETQFRRCVEEHQDFTNEHRIFWPNGETRWVRLQSRITYERDTQASGSTSLVLDITAQKLAEIALRDSEAKFRCLFEHSMEATFLASADGTIIAANPAACRLFGRSEEELCRVGRAALIEPGDPRHAELTRERARNGKARGEATFRRKDGTTFPGEVSSVTIDGTPPQSVVTLRDMTLHKMAEAALRDREAQLRLLADSIPQLVWAARPNGITDYYNHQFLSYLGKTLAEMQGWRWMSVLHPDDLAGTQAAWARAIQTGEPYEIEYRILRASDGCYRWHVGRALPLRDDHGNITRWFGTCTDIEAQKQSEELSLKQQLELAHLSRISSVGEMASSLAHELNQPLTAIMGYAGICCDAMRAAEGSPPKLVGFLEEVCKEARRAAEIIQRLRAYIRKDAPRVLEREIDSIVIEAVELMTPEFRRAGITPVLSLAEELPRVSVDAVQIHQVLINLFQNAVDAMDGLSPAQCKLGIETSRDASGGVKVSVTDGGRGMKPEVAAKIFEPFFTTKEKGLGLGLSICRSIIEIHGGQLSSRGVCGGGMEFAFSLPAAERINDANARSPAVSSKVQRL